MRRLAPPGESAAHFSLGRDMDLEYKRLDNPFVRFAFDGESGSGAFSGYGSVFGNVDSYGDVVERGAYAETLDAFLASGFIAVGHDWSATPVAYPTSAYEDDYGLHLTAQFHSTAAAQDARAVMRERIAAGKSVGLSIGYRVRDSVDREDGVRELRGVDLYEVSIVTVPANRSAVVTGAKSGLHAGLSFAEHSDAVREAVEEFVARSRAIAGLRAKEGRVLSSATRARIASARESIEDSLSALADVDADLADLLAATVPQPKSAARTEVATEYARYLRAEAARLGVR